jgi:flavin-dependent thymidylate synthase
MTKAVERWADEAMFEAEEMPFDVNKEGPQAYLLQGTPDPLGSIVAFSSMYTGKVVRNKRDVTDDERRYHLEQMKATKLKAPLEAVNLHWMLEGVTRSFTHQMVRQRTAVYAQESLRFAVKENMDEEVALPPSLLHLPQDHPRVMLWKRAVHTVDDIYNALVSDGVPAEDARGLLPHAITTRLNYHTNLRNFQDHAGNRLCTQAQFEWRAVWTRMIQAMRAYCTNDACQYNHGHSDKSCDNWQWNEIADLFRPVCYYTGKCEFMAEFDRACNIRERVQANHEIGRASTEWDKSYDPYPHGGTAPVVEWDPAKDGKPSQPVFIGPIQPAEWLLDPKAAR